VSRRIRIRTLMIVTAAAMVTLALVLPARASFPGQGGRVLFARQRQIAARGGSGALDLYTMRPNGNDQHRVVRTRALTELGGHWSPDGSQIVFMGSKGKGNADIYTADADGTHRDALTSAATNLSPNWSRNGRHIVWTRLSGVLRQERSGLMVPRRGGSAKLMIMDADGRHKRSVYSGNAVSPGWDPTAGRIAFSTSDADSLDVWTIKPNGLGLHQLTDYGSLTTTTFGDWAPDGDSFAFTFNSGGGNSSLWVAPTANPNIPEMLAAGVLPVFAPVFTTNGSRVIFVRDDGTDLELFSVKTDGTGERQLTTNGADDILTLIPLL
jgi:Tol biopolymer transport system component